MTSAYHSTRISVALAAVVFVCVPRAAVSETPGEIPKPWTYEGSMKLQEQQRQQDPQFQQRPQTRQGGGIAASGGAGAAVAEVARRTVGELTAIRRPFCPAQMWLVCCELAHLVRRIDPMSWSR
jgi:hypothetical protein